MTIEGFHVSRYNYVPGEIVKIEPNRITHFHTALEQTNNVAAEDRLKPYRPNGVPCRTNCIFVFGSLAECSLYGSSEHKNQKVYYYRVRMESATAVPMVLVDHIRKQVEPSARQVEQMAREYWQPTNPWEFREYLTEAIEVAETVEPLDVGSFEVMGAQCSFGNDNELARKFCHHVMNSE